MWHFLMLLLPIQALNYICTSPFYGMTHYYSEYNAPIPTHLITNESHCSMECSPCVWSEDLNMMVGYHSVCVPSEKDQLRFKLKNSTQFQPYVLTQKIEPGIYHSYGMFSFTSHTYLCLYSPIKKNEIEEEFPPDEISTTPLSIFPYSRFDMKKSTKTI